MCLDNIEEIGAAVEAAKKAKAESVEFERELAEPGALEIWQMDELTTYEVRLIHANRIAAAEQALKDLGFRGPLAKAAPADSADSQRVISAR